MVRTEKSARTIFYTAIFLGTVALMTGGCGSNQRQAVSGKVTLDGPPVAQGSVVFQPSENLNVAATGAAIVNGEFSVPKANGPLPGKHLLKVCVMRESGQVFEEFGRRIPQAKPIEIVESAGIPVTVADGGENRFDVQVHAAKKH